jgi:protein SCO1/2
LNDELSQGWTVATFADPTRIKHFADSLGYKFFWSPADRMFFHPNALFFVSPDGRVSRILHNAVSDARDMELAILDAKFSRMRPSEILNVAVSLCYSYNYKEGKYGLNYPLFIAVGSLVTGISAFAFAANVSRKKKSKINLGKGE